jgi:chaperone modulatory protein CbpM
MQQKTRVLEGLIITETTLFTVEEFCSACTVTRDAIEALVDEGIVEPVSEDRGQPRFSGASLARARTALRLQRDMEINLAGVALALDLMDEIRDLRRRLAQLNIPGIQGQ